MYGRAEEKVYIYIYMNRDYERITHRYERTSIFLCSFLCVGMSMLWWCGRLSFNLLNNTCSLWLAKVTYIDSNGQTLEAGEWQCVEVYKYVCWLSSGQIRVVIDEQKSNGQEAKRRMDSIVQTIPPWLSESSNPLFYFSWEYRADQITSEQKRIK